MTILHEIKTQLEQLTHFSSGEWAMDYTIMEVDRIVFGPGGRVILNFNVRVAFDSSKDEPSQDNSNL